MLECLPSKTFLKVNSFIKVERIRQQLPLRSSNSSSNIDDTKSPEVIDKSSNNVKVVKDIPYKWQIYIAPIAWIVVLSLVYNCKYNINQSLELVKYLRLIEDFLRRIGIYVKEDVMIDSLVGFISWPVTYLFIRRWLNPESRKDCFQKYSQDTFFGGIAAGCNVLLRSILLNCIRTTNAV